MVDDARRRYNDFNLITHRLEVDADEAAVIADECDLPGAEAALEGVATIAYDLRRNLKPEHFEEADDGE